jgi:hypothetical protein
VGRSINRSILIAFSTVAMLAQLGLGHLPQATASTKPAAPPPSSSPPSATVTLITGDRVLVQENAGRQSVVTDTADRGRGTAPVAFSVFTWRGDTYAVPSDALPYLGRQLDPSLFDVSALVRDKITGNASLPLSVSYTSGGSTALPGISLGARHGSQVRAKQLPFQAAEFGRALAMQLQADVARAHGHAPVIASHLFAGIRSISLAAPAPRGRLVTSAPPSTSRQKTLTLNAIDRDGNPADSSMGSGYMIVDDVDNPNAFAAIIPVAGTQNWSVPAGNYEVRAFIDTWFQKKVCFTTSSGQQCSEVWDYDMSFVWDPQLHVNRNMSVTLDARTANPIPIPSTPDSDTSACCNQNFQLVSDRVARTGEDIPWFWQSGGHYLYNQPASLEMFAAPSGGAITGSMHFYTYLRLQSASTGHTYDLVDPSASGKVPSSFPTSVSASQLAAIPTTYDSEVPGRPGGQVRFAYQPWQTTSVSDFTQLPEPASRTEYVEADPATAQTLWQEAAFMYSSFLYPLADEEWGPYTSYTPGTKPAVTWLAAPRHPGLDQPGPTVPAAGFTCPACRDNGQLSLDIKPYVGGDPTHWGGPLTTGNQLFGTSLQDSINLKYYQNGTLISSQDRTSNPTLGSAPVLLPAAPGPAQYRIDYDVTRKAPWSLLSTQTSTEWDFSSQAPVKSDPMPAGWNCGQLTGACSFVPLLLADYSLPLDQANSAPAPGAFTFTVHLYHQIHAITEATIDSPAVSVSYDDGTTWAPATSITSLGGGSYQVTVTHPDPSTVSGFVSLRLQASDSAGSSIDQTIIRAYILRGSPAASQASAAAQTATPRGTAALCPAQQAPYASCDAVVATNAAGRMRITPAATVSPASPPPGYGPADLESAYNLPISQGGNETVAVVDAPGDPNIAADLATYRAEYGLPACTTGNGCLNIVNQDGSGPPSGLFNNPNWGVETALDLDMVSAACPACHILLVEANDASIDDLGTAVQTAIRLGANVVSNSYGGYELAGVTSYAHYYQSRTVPIVASSGDNGYGLNGTLGGTQFPASVPTVTAVGGTTLTRDPHTARGWTETAWSGSGSGCSAYFAKPAWQRDSHCGMRTVADTSAVADPNTPVAVYDSYLPGGQPGWLLVGGTSAAAPLIAAVYALAGNTTQAASPAYLYGHTHSLNDVVSGSNGSCGKSNYLCNAKHGYDGPTGWGTPDGTGAF